MATAAASRASRRRRVHALADPCGPCVEVPAAGGLLACALALAIFAGEAVAGSGFLLRSQSTTTLGSAQAGMSTGTEDVSTMVFNPALLGWAPRLEFVGAITPIVSRGRFDPQGASTALGTPIGGGNGGNSAKTGWPINLMVGGRLAPDWSAGFALTTFHGLGFQWDPGWVGRYHAGESELLTLDLMPAIAWKPASKGLSLGVALDARYARAKTTTAIDFGTAAAAITRGLVGIPAGNDGSLHTRLDDWGFGVVAGAVYEPDASTRVGVSYRSRVRTTLSGNATFDLGGPAGQVVAIATGQFGNGGATAPLDFPAAVIAGFERQVAPRWWVMADAQWTQWSTLDALRLRISGTDEIVTDLRWRNSWFYTLGARHSVDEHWTLRAGVAYDQTPTRRATSTPAIPDASGVWTDVGASYAFGKDQQHRIDVAYGHVFARDNPIALSVTMPGNAARGSLAGTIRGSSADFVGVQYRYRL